MDAIITYKAFRKEYEDGLVLHLEVTEFGTEASASWDDPGGYDHDHTDLDSAVLEAFGTKIDLLAAMPKGANAFDWLKANNPDADNAVDAVITEDRPVKVSYTAPERDCEDAE